MYLKDGVRYTEKGLQRRAVSNPLEKGYVKLVADNYPPKTGLQRYVDAGNIEVDGVWYIDWQVEAKPQAEIDAYLESLRLSAKTRLKAERDAIVDQPINNVQVASISDRENIQGYLLYETEEPIEWVMADNTFQLLMKTDLQVIQSTYISRKKLAYEAYAAACRALEEATTQAEIDAVEVVV